MTGEELIVAALAAGAAVEDAYADLKRMVARRGGDDLIESGADRDAEILAAAQRLLALVTPAGPGARPIRIDRASGASIGDGNHQTNNFYG